MSRERFSRVFTIVAMVLLAQACSVDDTDILPSDPGAPSEPAPAAEPGPDRAEPVPATGTTPAEPAAPPAALAPAPVAVAPAPASSPAESPLAPDPDDQVDLGSLLSVAGAADITHGTGPYRRPDSAPQDERADRVFVAFLSGGQEVPAVSTPAEGAMALIVNRQQNRLRFVLRHQVSEATVAHLHIGSAGENGDVAVALPSAARASEGWLSVTPQQVEQLRAGRIYVNVHSKTFAKGEIRGQVLRPGETVFVAPLRGSEEVPPVETAASGLATLILSPERDQLRVRVTFAGITPTVAHIHRGIAGVNGMVVKPLPVGAVIEGDLPIDATDLKDLSLRQWYVNLHSAARPMGELRGQVVRPGETIFAAALSPAQEVPPVTASSTANAMLVVGSAGAKFLYVINTTAPVTIAHIHRAPAGSNGPIEVPLDPVGPEMSGIRDLGPTRRNDLEQALWYVNLHTAANPTGELRGQLLPPGAPSPTPTPPATPIPNTPHAH